jgi:hypothetical protein
MGSVRISLRGRFALLRPGPGGAIHAVAAGAGGGRSTLLRAGWRG